MFGASTIEAPVRLQIDHFWGNKLSIGTILLSIGALALIISVFSSVISATKLRMLASALIICATASGCCYAAVEIGATALIIISSWHLFCIT